MVLFTPEKLIFKGSKKQHQILAQTAYYQAGKIVVQTILPEQSPVALITLNTLGTTCSTSADTYIPIENIFNTQSCSSLESRLVSLYGGKAASLLIEYEQRLKFLNKNNNSSFNDSSLTQNKSSIYPIPITPLEYRKQKGKGACCTNRRFVTAGVAKRWIHLSGVNTISPASARVIPDPVKGKNANLRSDVYEVQLPLGAPRLVEKHIPFNFNDSGPSKEGLTKQSSPQGIILFQRGQNLTKQKIGKRSQAGTETKLTNNVQSQVFNFPELTLLPNSAAELRTEWKPSGKARLVRTCFAGAGNNIFQSTLGNIEIQTATRLARIMVNYWNFYSLNKIFLYSLVKKYDLADNSFGVPVHRKTSINSINKLANFSNSSSNDSSFVRSLATLGKSSICIPRAIARERIFPYKSTICKASARLELHTPKGSVRVGSFSNATLAPPAFYKSKTFQGINNWESKNSMTRLQSRNGIPYLAKGFLRTRSWKFHVNDDQTSVWLRFSRGNASKQLKDQKQKDLSYILKEESVAKELEAEGDTKGKCNVRVWGIKLKVKDKTPQGNIIYKYKIAKLNSVRNNLYFAIAQSKNSLKICENKNSSYSIQRLSIENIGNYSQLNNNNFQLINSLQFSHLQRDRFYPNWFRLYLPDMEATEFLKNIANYYFSLGLQTLTFPSTKSNYSLLSSGALGKLNVSTASPFLSFLNKNTQKEKYKLLIPNISSYTYCPPAILRNSPAVKSSNSRNKLTPRRAQLRSVRCWGALPQYPLPSALLRIPLRGKQKGMRRKEVRGMQDKLTLGSKAELHREQDKWYFSQRNTSWVAQRRIHFSGAKDIKDPSFTKVEGVKLDPLNVPFSLLLESQIFPLNYNDFSIVEKELLYNTLVNSSFAKAFYLINQNRQLLDFFVDYLLRFQILRQHQILYLFSTLLLSCTKTA